MNFLNPFVLFGLLAASIPILIHLLNLRKQKTVEFSSLKFLKELQKTRIRRLKIKQILLLILRALIVIFAVLAFSRPTTEGSLPLLESYSNASSVILIDNSFSLNVSDEYGNRFNQVKSAAESVIKSLTEGDELAIIEMANLAAPNQYSFSSNFDLLAERISQIELSYNKASLDHSLKLATALLDNSKNLNRDIFIITDAQANVFESTDDSLSFEKSNYGIYLLPIGSETLPDNMHIDSLNLITSIFQIDKSVEFEASVHNSSTNDRNGTVMSLFFNGERVSQRPIDLPKGKTNKVLMSSVPKSRGVVKAELTLEPDALDMDNSYYFSFVIPENPQVAVFSDKPDFLRAALSNERLTNFADAEFLPATRLATVNLNEYDLIIISSVAYTQGITDRIKQYVSGGGSVIIFPPKDISAEEQAALVELGFGNVQEIKFGTSSPGKFSGTDLDHPIFEGVFENRSADAIESPDIYVAHAVTGGQQIIMLESAGFLSESRIENGKIFYFAVPADLSISNFPMTGLFPTLIYRSIVYLTASEQSSDFYHTGENVTMTIPGKFSSKDNFKLITPDDVEIFIQAVELPTGAIAELGNLDSPGNYELQTSTGELVSLIAVNTIPSESIISRIDIDDAESQILARFGDDASIETISTSDEIAASVIRARAGTELWQLFVILSILCAVAELIVQRSIISKT